MSKISEILYCIFLGLFFAICLTPIYTGLVSMTTGKYIPLDPKKFTLNMEKYTPLDTEQTKSNN